MYNFQNHESSLLNPIEINNDNMMYLFNLNSLNIENPFIIEAIKEMKLAAFHNGMIFLSYLITLWQVRIIIVFSIKLYSLNYKRCKLERLRKKDKGISQGEKEQERLDTS
jgi:hypothetical protein